MFVTIHSIHHTEKESVTDRETERERKKERGRNIYIEKKKIYSERDRDA